MSTKLAKDILAFGVKFVKEEMRRGYSLINRGLGPDRLLSASLSFQVAEHVLPRLSTLAKAIELGDDIEGADLLSLVRDFQFYVFMQYLRLHAASLLVPPQSAPIKYRVLPQLKQLKIFLRTLGKQGKIDLSSLVYPDVQNAFQESVAKTSFAIIKKILDAEYDSNKIGVLSHAAEKAMHKYAPYRNHSIVRREITWFRTAVADLSQRWQDTQALQTPSNREAALRQGDALEQKLRLFDQEIEPLYADKMSSDKDAADSLSEEVVTRIALKGLSLKAKL